MLSTSAAFSQIEQFLALQMGLDARSIGLKTLHTIYQKRLEITHLSATQYFHTLRHSAEEQQALIESIIVLETSFFRHHKAFDYLADYVMQTWLSKHTIRSLRILSLPCATGEEPYTLYMRLIAQGFPAQRLHIDAVDISQYALEKAKTGLYTSNAFRNAVAQKYQSRFFNPIERHGIMYYQIKHTAQQRIYFKHGNILNQIPLANGQKYDIIFCRNILIYLTKPAQQQVFKYISQALQAQGLLFVGHAERPLLPATFENLPLMGVFACRYMP